MELTKDERLALLVAMDKRIKPGLDEAKADARRELLDSFDTTHSDRRAILVGSEKVGEVGISYSTSKPVILAGMESQAIEALRALGLTEEVPKKGWEKAFALVNGNVVCAETGEPAEWAMWQPQTVKAASVRGCEPDSVLSAMAGRLEASDVYALLEGGNDGR